MKWPILWNKQSHISKHSGKLDNCLGFKCDSFKRSDVQCLLPLPLHVYSFPVSLPSFLRERIFSRCCILPTWSPPLTDYSGNCVQQNEFPGVHYTKVLYSLRSPTYSYHLEHLSLELGGLIHNYFSKLKYWKFTIFQVPGPTAWEAERTISSQTDKVCCVLIPPKVDQLQNGLSGSLGKHFNCLSWHYILQVSTEWMPKC